MKSSAIIRPASPGDCEEIVGMIRELAEFEKLLDQVETTPESLEQALFESPTQAECLVAEFGGNLLGYALFFTTFSSFKSKSGLWLEDVYVRPEFRGQGIGKAFLNAGAQTAIERGYARFEWCVLDWNTNAIAVYEKSGATVLPDWRIVRTEGGALKKLATDIQK